MTVELLTASRLSTYQCCPRKHYLRYDCRISPLAQANENLRFGSLWHLAQENYWLAIAAGEFGRAGEIAATAVNSSNGDPFEIAKCAALIDGYHRYWYTQTINWVIHGVESEFRIPLINPASGRRSRRFDLGGKIDLIVEVLSGLHSGLYVVEHKTAKGDVGSGSLYQQKLRMNDQITIYMDGARSLGYDVRGCIYDVLAKPGQVPLAATPGARRRYTKGMGCRGCGGSRGEIGCGVGEGTGRDGAVDCPECDGTGWKDPPRLDSRQRTEDETPAEYGNRILKAIEASPSAFFVRSDPPIVRLDDEVNRLRQNHWHYSQELIADRRRSWHPMNTSSCDDWFSLCEYWPICTGDSTIENRELYYRRSHMHLELSGESQRKDKDGSDKKEE